MLVTTKNKLKFDVNTSENYPKSLRKIEIKKFEAAGII